MSKENTCIMTTTKESANLLALATSIYINYFGHTPSINAYETEIKCIEEDLKYLYDNMANRAEAKEKERSVWNSCRSIDEIESTTENENIPVLPNLYWINTSKSYDTDGESFPVENSQVVYHFDDAERIMKEIMHDKNDYNGNGILEYVSVEIYETTWNNGELTPTFPVMKYVDNKCTEPGKGELYRAEKTIIIENDEEKEIAVYIDETAESVMKHIKSGATVSVHEKKSNYVIYKIITDGFTLYYGVEIPKETK